MLGLGEADDGHNREWARGDSPGASAAALGLTGGHGSWDGVARGRDGHVWTGLPGHGRQGNSSVVGHGG